MGVYDPRDVSHQRATGSYAPTPCFPRGTVLLRFSLNTLQSRLATSRSSVCAGFDRMNSWLEKDVGKGGRGLRSSDRTAREGRATSRSSVCAGFDRMNSWLEKYVGKC